MFPHFIGVETETQRGQVTGLEVRESLWQSPDESQC